MPMIGDSKAGELYEALRGFEQPGALRKVVALLDGGATASV